MPLVACSLADKWRMFLLLVLLPNFPFHNVLRYCSWPGDCYITLLGQLLSAQLKWSTMDLTRP